MLQRYPFRFHCRSPFICLHFSCFCYLQTSRVLSFSLSLSLSKAGQKKSGSHFLPKLRNYKKLASFLLKFTKSYFWQLESLSFYQLEQDLKFSSNSGNRTVRTYYEILRPLDWHNGKGSTYIRKGRILILHNILGSNSVSVGSIIFQYLAVKIYPTLAKNAQAVSKFRKYHRGPQYIAKDSQNVAKWRNLAK